MAEFPHRQTLMQATLTALETLGGSGTVEELVQQVISTLNLSDEIVEQKHRTRDGEVNRTHLDYELAWARTYLKQLGLLENSARGVWALTPASNKESVPQILPVKALGVEAPDAPPWEEQLSALLCERLSPGGFERLIQRILRETGFSHVEITGRTNDGGIDGRGIATINGMLSFRVAFQCKRYKGGVGASVVRDFRGALMGRADKGLILTTGYFTREAIKEASRDGALAIDLYDGTKIVSKLKTLRLGWRLPKWRA